jgi:hypothetical protein
MDKLWSLSGSIREPEILQLLKIFLWISSGFSPAIRHIVFDATQSGCEEDLHIRAVYHARVRGVSRKSGEPKLSAFVVLLPEVRSSA